MRVKICGLRTAKAVDAAVQAGADAIGFVFAPSPRQLTPAQARPLLARVPPGIERVAVFRSPAPDLLSEVLTLPIDVVQASASWDCRALPLRIAFLPWFPDDPELLAQLSRWASRPHLHHPSPASPRRRRPGLLGSFVVDAAGPGGTGQRADLDRAHNAASHGRMILAGGLDPSNVAAAITHVRPHGVDVSSGVERAPGLKDPTRITAFIEAVRATEA